jgi:hypothetical protein
MHLNQLLGFRPTIVLGFSLRFCTETFLFYLLLKFALHLFLFLYRGTLHRRLGSVDSRFILAVLVVGSADVVPPAEGRGEIVGESHVVEVVVVSARPKWDNVLERPGKV